MRDNKSTDIATIEDAQPHVYCSVKSLANKTSCGPSNEADNKASGDPSNEADNSKTVVQDTRLHRPISPENLLAILQEFNDAIHSSQHVPQGEQALVNNVCLTTMAKQCSDNLSTTVNIPETCSTVSNTSSIDTTKMINEFVAKHFGTRWPYDLCETSSIDSDDLFKSGSVPVKDVDTETNRDTSEVPDKPCFANDQNIHIRRQDVISDETIAEENEPFRKELINNRKSAAGVFEPNENIEPGLSEDGSRQSVLKRTRKSDLKNTMQMDIQLRRLDTENVNHEQCSMAKGGYDLSVRFSSDHSIGSDIKPIVEAGKPIQLRGNISSELEEFSTGTNTRLKGVISINMSADLTTEPIYLK